MNKTPGFRAPVQYGKSLFTFIAEDIERPDNWIIDGTTSQVEHMAMDETLSLSVLIMDKTRLSIPSHLLRY